jgi:hypothetical protein
MGKPEGKRQLIRRRWEGNINVDLKEIEWCVRTRLIWLRIGTGGELLCTR